MLRRFLAKQGSPAANWSVETSGSTVSTPQSTVRIGSTRNFRLSIESTRRLARDGLKFKLSSVGNLDVCSTQNKIKNRFYGTLRNYVRFVLNKFDHQKSYNHLISKLSPRFLNNLYAGQKDLSFLRGEVKHTIRKMNYHVDKEILSQRIDEHYKLYELLAYRVKM